jgi:hypothetical protein
LGSREKRFNTGEKQGWQLQPGYTLSAGLKKKSPAMACHVVRYGQCSAD